METLPLFACHVKHYIHEQLVALKSEHVFIFKVVIS